MNKENRYAVPSLLWVIVAVLVVLLLFLSEQLVLGKWDIKVSTSFKAISVSLIMLSVGLGFYIFSMLSGKIGKVSEIVFILGVVPFACLLILAAPATMYLSVVLGVGLLMICSEMLWNRIRNGPVIYEFA